MARKLRIEFPGAIYHLINRGNYRRWVFETDRTKQAFEWCLFDACRKSRWVLHAYVIMGNHFHLAVETPEGNLVAGMHWLQATFANRFNRLRDERGHLFQSRYKSLLVEAGNPLWQLCHYIHLNPVRAGIVGMVNLAKYRYSSYWYLRHVAARPEFLAVTTALEGAGALADTPAGRRSYQAYLEWQAAEGPAGKSKAHVNLSRGWALGSAAFKGALIAGHKLRPTCRAWTPEGARAVREQHACEALGRALKAAGKSAEEARQAPRSAPWKLAIAVWLKIHTQARNHWIAEALCLGAPAALSRNLTRFRRNRQPEDPTWKRLMSISAT